MKVVIDKNKCFGCGACEETCPEVFKVVEGIATVKVEIVPNICESKVEEAKECCPAGAIKIISEKKAKKMEAKWEQYGKYWDRGVLEQLARLGWEPREVKNGRWPAQIELLLALDIPIGKQYKNEDETGEAYEVWDLSWGTTGVIDWVKFADNKERKLVQIAQFDGGNYLIGVDVDDKNLADPYVYKIDHDSPEVVDKKVRLSKFLEGLVEAL